MRIAASSLGCPAWTLEDILRRFPECGLDAVEFRGIAGGLDVTVLPEFTSGLAASARLLGDAGLAVTGIGSSIRLCDPAAREAGLEEARRTIPVALGLGAPSIRVFGGGPLAEDGSNRAELVKIGTDCLKAILDIPGAGRVDWLLETHDHWLTVSDLRSVVDPVGARNAGVLWDIAHTLRRTGETPGATIAGYGALIRNTHVKDAAGREPDAPYVLPGTGVLPLAEAVRALKAAGYGGALSLEHEKRWNPELPEPEVVYPVFARWAKQFV